jgi:hypothetical protein
MLTSVLPLLAGATCDVKEYAQYKDNARTRSGQIGLAFDLCHAQIQYDLARKNADLALQYRVLRDADRAQADMRICAAEQSKIRDALSGVNAYKALEFARGGCQGDGTKLLK